jgi:hypothetical protein
VFCLRLAGTAAQRVDELRPDEPLRQWVLSVPHALCVWFATRPAIMGRVLAIVYRTIATHLFNNART